MKRGDVFVLGMVFGSILGMVVTASSFGSAADHLGSKGAHCFANHTCRENLKCLVADGIDATCVKP